MPDELSAPAGRAPPCGHPPGTHGPLRAAVRRPAARSPLPAGRLVANRPRRRKSPLPLSASPTRSVRSNGGTLAAEARSAVVRYPPKATVGYQSGPGRLRPGADGPPWTNACAARGRATSRHTSGIGPAPQHEHPVAAVGVLKAQQRETWGDFGGAWHPVALPQSRGAVDTRAWARP